MIEVSFYYQKGNIVKTEVKGHANFDDLGKDIVCAGVSAIVFGTLNAIDNLVDQKEVELNQTSNQIVIKVLNPTNNNQVILNTMLWQLKTIHNQYSKNIIIKEVY